ncbi:MAG TPA: methylmalonyl Co-A mutase-associated GTPase MeaB [Actinomycetota bacterium]|nr:methylmalonyl Co-A mutase-associated GTPase MeaB [Actinomycetota bacterium]
MDLDELIRRALAGERRAVARLISLVEDGGADLGRVMQDLYPHTGSAYSVGITGAPGAGKSTLTERLVGRARADSLTVGVLAIDPSSPFSGGALLGDRVRMQSHATDPEVFIRSMATRGHLGGISLATPEAFRVLDAAGKDLVLIETVGVGQAEVEITDACDTTLVVVNPGWGDAVQAAKAGLMEIADVFVVNKADRNGTRQAVQELRQMLELSEADWKPEIVETVATKGTGIDELWAAVEKHRAYQEEQGLLEARRRRRVQREIKEIVAERYRARVEHEQVVLLDEMTAEVAARRLDPYAAADRLIAALA